MAKYTRIEITTVIQFIFDHLADMPSLLETQEIFKQAGSKDKIEELINKIINHQSFPPSRFGPHDYMGALSYLLKNELTIYLTGQKIQPLVKALPHLDLTNTKSTQQTLDLLTTYIDSLANSQDENDIMLAYALYNYCHFAEEATLYTIKNKMRTDNISKVLGSFFQIHLMPTVDAPTAAALLSGLLEQALKRKMFEDAFEMKYPNQMAQIYRQQLQEIQQAIKALDAIHPQSEPKHQTQTGQQQKFLHDSDLPEFSQNMGEIEQSRQQADRQNLYVLAKTFQKKLRAFEDLSHLPPVTFTEQNNKNLSEEEDADEPPVPPRKRKKPKKRKSN